MKKLITGAVASLALLFGFASCSGDLHDNDVQPLYIVGSGFEGATWDLEGSGDIAKATLANADGSAQKYALKATASKAEVKFATARSWSKDIAGDDKNDVVIGIGDDYTKLHSRESEGLPNTKNVIINDLTPGNTYNLDIKFDPISFATSVKISGDAAKMPVLNLVISGKSVNFPEKDKDGNENVYTMLRAGSVYSYEFISKDTENISLHFESDMGATLLGAPEKKDNPYEIDSKTGNPKESYFLKIASKSDYYEIKTNTNEKDEVSYERVFNENSVKKIVNELNTSIAVKKNGKYKFSIDVSNGINNAIYNFEEKKMLETASINGNWKYPENFYEQKGSSYQFFAENENLLFTVNRAEGDSELAWGNATIKVDGDAKELSYFDNGNATPVKVEGLKTGTCYKITISEDTDNFVLTAEIKKVSLANLENYLLAGNMNGWPSNMDDSNKLTKNGDGTYSVEFVASAETVECKIHKDGDWNTDCWTLNGVQSVNETKDWHVSGLGENNSTIKGLVSGNSYKMVITPDYGKISVKVISK